MTERSAQDDTSNESPRPAYLRRQRERAGMTQSDLARSVGVAQQTVSAWESGRAAPNQEHLNSIEDVLGVSLTDWASHSTRKPSRHLRPVNSSDSEDVQPVRSEPDLTAEQRFLRSALVARIQKGEPLGLDEIDFLRQVARLHGVEL